MTCPECNGRGVVGGARGQVGGEQQTVIWEGEGCWECDGDGEVTVAQYDDWCADQAAAFNAQIDDDKETAAWLEYDLPLDGGRTGN